MPLTDASAAGLSHADAEKLKLLAPQLTYFLQNQTGASDLNVAVAKSQIDAMASNQKPEKADDIKDSGKDNKALPFYYGFEFKLETARGDLNTAFTDPENKPLTYRVEVYQNGEVKSLADALGSKVTFDASTMTIKAETGWSHATAEAVGASETGTYKLKVTAIDNYGRTASQDFFLYFNKNQPVEVTQTGELATNLIDEGSAITAADTGLSFTGSDGDGANDQITWSLEGAWKDYFELENTVGADAGKLKIVAKTAAQNTIDFETNPTITVTVVATDDRGAQTKTNETVAIKDVNEAPILAYAKNITTGVTEGQPYILKETALKASDPNADDEPTYTFKGFTTANAANTDNKLQVFVDSNWSDLAVDGTFTQTQVKDEHVRLNIGDNQARDTKLILSLADKSGLAGTGDDITNDQIEITVSNIANVADIGSAEKFVNVGQANDQYTLAAGDIVLSDSPNTWHSIEITGLPASASKTSLHYNDNGSWKKIVSGTSAVGANEIALNTIGKIISADMNKLRFIPDSDFAPSHQVTRCRPSSDTLPTFKFTLYRTATDNTPATDQIFNLNVNFAPTAKGVIGQQVVTKGVAFTGPDMDDYFSDRDNTALEGTFVVTTVSGPNNATALPAGITLNPTTHVFSGTESASTAYGTYRVTVTYTDKNGDDNAPTATQSFDLHYLEAGTSAVDTPTNPTFYNGLGGNDTITGGAGNDRLYGGAGNDTIDGAAGDDILHDGAGADTITGGAGSDTASYEGSNAQVTIDLNVAHQVSWVAANDVKGSVLVAGDANKYIIATANNNVWTISLGGTTETAGANKLILGWLDDTGLALDTSNATDPLLSIDGTTLKIAASTRGGGDATGDLLSGIENLIGGGGADNLTGDANANIINGGAGNDTINSGAGNDVLIGGAGIDGLTGGAGQDTLTGGAGDDVFDVGNVAGTRAAADIIKDFTAGDTIKLGGDDQIDWKASGSDTILYKTNSAGTDNILAILEGYTGGLDMDDFSDITSNANVGEIV